MPTGILQRLALIVAMGTSGVAGAAVLKVPQQYPTIQAAVDVAEDGDTVKVAAGTYAGNIRIVGKAVSLIGAGASQTTIDAGGAGRAISVLYADITIPAPNHVTIAGFTIRNGSVHDDDLEDFGAGWGAGLYAWASTIVVRDNVFTGNRGCPGIAIAAIGTDATLIRNRIQANLTNGPGCVSGNAVALVGGWVELQAVVLQNVVRDHDASGMLIASLERVILRGNIFRRNRPDAVPGVDTEFGALSVVATQVTLQGNLFTENSATGTGGAVIAANPIVATGNSFVANHTDWSASSLELASTTTNADVVKDNRFDESGDSPAIRCDGTIPIDRSNVFASAPETALVGGCERIN